MDRWYTGTQVDRFLTHDSFHTMPRSHLLVLFLLGLAVPLVIAQFQSLPGYMDADYYFGGGIQLAKGNGFSEPYLWNYLADPPGLPAPSHAYWMPLASLLAAAGMLITGQMTFTAARLGFILLAALVPPLTSLLAFHLTSNRAASLLSGLLACFPVYYAPFLPVTDNYAIYMLLGISFFFLLSSLSSPAADDHAPITKHRLLITFFLFGLLSALMTLARSDGLLWLGMSSFVAMWVAWKQGSTQAGTQVHKYTGIQAHGYTGTQVYTHTRKQVETGNLQRLLPPLYFLSRSFIFHFSSFLFAILLGYLLLIMPWYFRNLRLYNSLMAPGGSRTLWLTNYNDTFLYPASQLTMERWLASGWDAILQARLGALKMNLLNAFAAQGGIFLFPFILMGLWQLRSDIRVRVAALAWVLLLFVMTVIFPFAGYRGAFFHAGAALQPIWWIAAPLGLDAVVALIRRKNLLDDRAFGVFRGALVGLALLMTAAIFAIRVLPGWEREDGHYAEIERLFLQQRAPSGAIVMVRNPPGYNVVTGRPAIALPAGGMSALLAVAERYDARYLILEPEGTSSDLRVLYDQPDSHPSFRYIGESDGNRLYEIIH